MLIAGKGAMAVNMKLTAKSYVHDGLVWQIDGIENVGYGQSSLTASGWTNLKTGEIYPFSKEDETPNWKGDCWESVAANDARFFIAKYPDIGTAGTIEIVVKKNTDARGIIIGSYWLNVAGGGLSYEYYTSRSFRAWYDGTPNVVTPAESFPVGRRKYFAAIRDEKNYAVVDASGVLTSVVSISRTSVSGKTYIGSDSRTTSMCLNGEICAIRIYNRALTADEIAANYAVDKVRFGID